MLLLHPVELGPIRGCFGADIFVPAMQLDSADAAVSVVIAIVLRQCRRMALSGTVEASASVRHLYVGPVLSGWDACPKYSVHCDCIAVTNGHASASCTLP